MLNSEKEAENRKYNKATGAWIRDAPAALAKVIIYNVSGKGYYSRGCFFGVGWMNAKRMMPIWSGTPETKVKKV